MFSRLVAVLVFAAVPGFCGDWNPRLAAEYLDSRQKEWFAWPAANAGATPCVSCHTSVPYLLVRPALRQALGESSATVYEKGLLDSLKSRVEKKDPKELFPKSSASKAAQAAGVESILAALFLGREWGSTAEKAFDRMWALQIRNGKSKGAWAWFDLDLDPWEMPESMFYGAAIAAMATSMTPTEYQTRPDIQENIAALRTYLKNEQEAQPLHNRLILLWASAKFRDVLSDGARPVILERVWREQQADGGWTLESLGAWKKHANAPPSSGANSYATGLVAFVLEQAGVARANPNLARALEWLKSHQDPARGYWVASSMNKRYEPDSMQIRFMQDAATAYATLALLEADRRQMRR